MIEMRRVFTPDEMLKIWNQFFLGSYILLPEKKSKKDWDGEEGLDKKNKILLLEDEDNQEAYIKVFGEKDIIRAKLNWDLFRSQEQQRTMDRYEQIHYFFSIIIEHNVKTLKSCEAMRLEREDSAKAEVKA